MKNVIEAKNLTKSFGPHRAVNGLNLEIREGECFGLLGPNGAGKSSAMRMFYCVSPITSGELYVLGLDVKRTPKKIKSSIGVVPQEDGLDPDFSVLDNLLVFSRYLGLDPKKARVRANELLRLMHLEDYADHPVDHLSGGMRRRLTIARALLNEPKMLFLDEPTTGLDPQARYWIWEFLKDLRSKGTSVLLTTHYMEEAETLCDRLVIMDKGRVLAQGTPRDLILELVGHEVIEFEIPIVDQNYYLSQLKDKFAYQILNQRVRLFVKGAKDKQMALTIINSDKIIIRKSTLDDVFLKLAGHELRN
ncbi:MAG: ABC transporter ATP-binding protein [Pseudobdellovibrionaceae bacterium]|nr:MAG: ABC transporter ATP-binding protein [Pseudobdellovibrionaceae bacterium]